MVDSMGKPRTMEEQQRMMDALTVLRTRGEEFAVANEALRRKRAARLCAAKKAHEAGAIQDLIAEAAGVTRDAVKKWASDWD